MAQISCDVTKLYRKLFIYWTRRHPREISDFVFSGGENRSIKPFSAVQQSQRRAHARLLQLAQTVSLRRVLHNAFMRGSTLRRRWVSLPAWTTLYE